MNKKALSPLIATIILIVISVGLGAVVMSWGEGYIEKQAQFVQASGKSELTACDGIDIKIVTTSTGQKICKGTNYIEATLENPTGKPIDGFNINIIGDDTTTERIPQTLTRGDVQKIKVQANTNKIELIKITPMIGATNCAGKTITVEKIKTCE